MTPPTPDNRKNAAIFNSTVTRFTLESAMLVMIVRAMMPSTSSMMAAPRMALPEWVFSFPSSFKVSTVMLTEVAVKMTPMNIF